MGADGALAQSVLDAWAVIAFLEGEPARRRVRAALERGAACSWINLGEALYKEARRVGWDRASEAVDSLARTVIAEPANSDIVCAAAAIKAEGGLSYADCFAIATAERHGAPLLTGDPEIARLQRPGLSVIDLRSA